MNKWIINSLMHWFRSSGHTSVRDLIAAVAVGNLYVSGNNEFYRFSGFLFLNKKSPDKYKSVHVYIFVGNTIFLMKIFLCAVFGSKTSIDM